MQYLFEKGVLESEPHLIAQFFHCTDDLDRKAIGEYIGHKYHLLPRPPPPFFMCLRDNSKVLEAFVACMDFSELSFDEALRLVFWEFRSNCSCLGLDGFCESLGFQEKRS